LAKDGINMVGHPWRWVGVVEWLSGGVVGRRRPHQSPLHHPSRMLAGFSNPAVDGTALLVGRRGLGTGQHLDQKRPRAEPGGGGGGREFSVMCGARFAAVHVLQAS